MCFQWREGNPLSTLPNNKAGKSLLFKATKMPIWRWQSWRLLQLFVGRCKQRGRDRSVDRVGDGNGNGVATMTQVQHSLPLSPSFCCYFFFFFQNLGWGKKRRWVWLCGEYGCVFWRKGFGTVLGWPKGIGWAAGKRWGWVGLMEGLGVWEGLDWDEWKWAKSGQGFCSTGMVFCFYFYFIF